MLRLKKHMNCECAYHMRTDRKDKRQEVNSHADKIFTLTENFYICAEDDVNRQPTNQTEKNFRKKHHTHLSNTQQNTPYKQQRSQALRGTDAQEYRCCLPTLAGFIRSPCTEPDCKLMLCLRTQAVKRKRPSEVAELSRKPYFLSDSVRKNKPDDLPFMSTYFACLDKKVLPSGKKIPWENYYEYEKITEISRCGCRCGQRLYG